MQKAAFTVNLTFSHLCKHQPHNFQQVEIYLFPWAWFLDRKNSP